MSFFYMVLMQSGRGQPPSYLSMFLKVMDSRNTSSDWSCFVSYRLSVVNQKMEDKSVTKESENRYTEAATVWGWLEFVTLNSLFTKFLVEDTVKFSAEVFMLKETSSVVQDSTEPGLNSISSLLDGSCKRMSFIWEFENLCFFKEIMERRRIYSKFFQIDGCKLRIGMHFIHWHLAVVITHF